MTAITGTENGAWDGSILVNDGDDDEYMHAGGVVHSDSGDAVCRASADGKSGSVPRQDDHGPLAAKVKKMEAVTVAEARNMTKEQLIDVIDRQGGEITRLGVITGMYEKIFKRAANIAASASTDLSPKKEAKTPQSIGFRIDEKHYGYTQRLIDALPQNFYRGRSDVHRAIYILGQFILNLIVGRQVQDGVVIPGKETSEAIRIFDGIRDGEIKLQEIEFDLHCGEIDLDFAERKRRVSVAGKLGKHEDTLTSVHTKFKETFSPQFDGRRDEWIVDQDVDLVADRQAAKEFL